jgi:hypothetical protein
LLVAGDGSTAIDGGDGAGALAIVEVLPIHLGVLCNASLAGLAADEGSAHGTGDDATGGNQDGGGQDQIGTPGHVGDEQEDVDEEWQQGENEGQDAEDEDAEQVAGGVGGGVEVSGTGEYEHDQGEEGGDGVHDEDGGEGGSRRGG